MAKRCNDCGFSDNPDSAKFCGKCGRSLSISKFGMVENREDSNGQAIQRNDLCPCGSGKRYKNCHGRRLQ